MRKLCKVETCLGKYDYESFLDVATFAQRFVDRTITEAVRTISKTTSLLSLADAWPECHPESPAPEEDWPSSGSISVRSAYKNVKRMMTQWNSLPAMEEWMYNVEFIGLKSDQSSDFYIFEVKWSVPTPEYPIPQVTASVFFSIEATRIKPKSFPVDVTYVFEGTQFVHRPNIPFQEKWLYDILDMKTMMFKTFHF